MHLAINWHAVPLAPPVYQHQDSYWNMHRLSDSQEIDWTQSIDDLIASPRLPPSAFSNTFEPHANDRNAEAIHGVTAAYSSFAPAYLQAQFDQGQWYSDAVYGTVEPYARSGAVTTASAQTSSPVKIVDLIKAGIFDVSTDSDTPTNRIDSPREGQWRQDRVPYQGSRNSNQISSSSTSTPPQAVSQSVPQALTLHGEVAADADPAWLEDALKHHALPSLSVAVQDMPFTDSITDAEVCKHGVIRFLNPPFYVTRTEVLSSLGRNAQVVHQPAGSPYHAVHILMERDTGKTQDIFVEVASVREARTIYEQFHRRAINNRSLTLGNSRAHVQLSSQGALMHALFPQARKVEWHGAKAEVDITDDYYCPGVKAVGFDGFLGDEETALLCKWLDSPSRSPFAQRCQNRPFESAITLLHKFPVDNPDNIKMIDRSRLYKIAFTAVKQLAELLRSDRVPDGLTRLLLQEVVVAAFGQPVFADQQRAAMLEELRKYSFDSMVTNPGMMVTLGRTHEFADRWPFLILQRKPSASIKLVRFYAKLIRDFTQAFPDASFSPDERIAARRVAAAFSFNEPFFLVRIMYGNQDIKQLSWSDCLRFELEYVSNILEAQLSQH